MYNGRERRAIGKRVGKGRLLPYLPDRVSRAAGRVSVDCDYFVEQKEFLRDRIGGFASTARYMYIYDK